MLSEAEWWRGVPRELGENLRYRREMLLLCRGERKWRRVVKRMCRDDLFFFIQVFVWQYNPTKFGEERGPFLLWDCQMRVARKILSWIEGGKDGLIEKSRDMGASWLCLIVILWLFLFHEDKAFLCISRNADLVESERSISLFWKLDFMLRYMPWWLKPKIKRRRMFFGNEETESTIEGEPSTGKAGVGARATFFFIDEFSQIEEDYEVLSRTSDTARCRIFNGTHLGLDTAFYELSNPNSKIGRNIQKVQLHWSEHPLKSAGLYRWVENKPEVLDKDYEYGAEWKFDVSGAPYGGPYPGVRSPWYDEQCGRKPSQRAIAMDLDIDPKGSTSQFFDAYTIRQLQGRCREPSWTGDLGYNKESGEPDGLVARRGGLIRMWMVPDYRGRVPSGMYVMGGDVATGKGASPSCLTVANAETGEKVLEYADAHIEEKEFAVLAVALGRLFADSWGTPARMCWEVPGAGYSFGRKVVDLGYPNVYYPGRSVTSVIARVADPRSGTPGFLATPSTKRLLLEEYREALQRGRFVNLSWLALEECLEFEYADGKNVVHSGSVKPDDPTKARDNHGDRVIADALAWKMMKELGLDTEAKREEIVPIRENTWEWRKMYHEQLTRNEGRWS